MTIRMAMSEYEKIKVAFLKKHKLDSVETSPMDEYGRYHKTYLCEDGQSWIEVNEPIYEKAIAETEIHGVKIKLEQDIKFFRSEGWSTLDANSIYGYEKF